MFRDRDRWRVHWRVNGRRRTKSFATQDEARLFELKLKLGQIEPDCPTIDRGRRFSSLCEEWYQRHVLTLKAPSQHIGDRSRLDVHILPALGDLTLGEVTERRLAEFRGALVGRKHPRTGRPLKPKTMNQILAQLKHITRKGVRWRYFAEDPATDLEYFPAADPAFDFWTPDERDRFWRFARQVDPEFAEAAHVAAFTGLRRGELQALQRHQLDFGRDMIRVDASWCFKTSQRLPRTKNGRIGYVPMIPEVRELLKRVELAAATAPVFTPDLLRHAAQRLRRLCAKVKARPIRFHDLRHSFGSALAMAGVESYTRQRLMRHETPAMTQRYSHLAPDHMREAIHALSHTRNLGCNDAESLDNWSRRPDLKSRTTAATSRGD